jgi:hypothetical protein
MYASDSSTPNRVEHASRMTIDSELLVFNKSRKTVRRFLFANQAESESV